MSFNLIIWNLVCVSLCIQNPVSQTNLNDYVTSHLAQQTSNHRDLDRIHVPQGIYTGGSIELRDVSLVLKGIERENNAANQLPKITFNSLQSVNTFARNMVSPICPTIFALHNSTFSVERIHFSASNDLPDSEAMSDQNADSRIAVLDSSDLTLSFCVLLLRYSLSPFVVQQSDISEGGRGTSLLINKCTLHSDSGMIRGLLELSANQSSHSGHTVSIVGVAFSNTEIVGADGVSLSLRGTPASDGPISALSVSLVENRFQNMSTSRHVPNPIWTAGLTQRMVGCDVSETSSHLTGSTLRDVHFGGSQLCSNTSFSALLSSLDQNDAETGTVDMPDETSHVFVDGTRYTFTADSGGESTAAVFTGCVFTGAKYATHSGTILVFTNFKGAIKLTKCCVLNVDAASLSFAAVANSAQQGGFTCEDCVFDKFTGTYTYSVFSFHDCTKISFTGCKFTDSVSSEYSSGNSGAITISNDVSKNNFYNFMFSNNEFSHLMYRGIYFEPASNMVSQSGEIKVTQCLFDDCHGDHGHGLGRYFYAPTTITHCKFTHCSKEYYSEGALSVRAFDVCTISDVEVADCDDLISGLGIYFEMRKTGSVEHCTMKNISTTYSGAGMSLVAEQTCLIFDCHFVDCSSQGEGGGVSIFCSDTATFIECSFTRCSGNMGSAIISEITNSFVVRDCLIQNCSTQSGGGQIGCTAIYDVPPKITLTRVIFANNTADTQAGETPFVDLFLFVMVYTPMDITVEDCFTLDEGQLAGYFVFNEEEATFVSHTLDVFQTKGPKLTKTAGGLIDQLTGEVRICLEAVVPLVDQEYDVTMTKEEAAENVTMRVRIENGVTQSNWTSNTKTTVLEYSTKYTITKIVGVVPPSESISNAVFTAPALPWEFDLYATPAFVSFITPHPPPILSVSCEDGLGTDHAWIQLTGMSIAEGTYTVCLTESTLTFNVTFSGSKDSKGQYKSSKASVRLFGDEALLSFGTKYTVKSVADASTLAPVDLVGMIISFTTPAASSRLTGIGEKKLIGDQKDSVSVSLTGADLKNMEYWIETSPSSEVNGAKLSVVFSESSGTLVGKVYSVSGSGVALEYGRTYSITKMTNAENDAVLFVPLSFTVPDEPARLVNVSLTVDANMNTSTLTLTARQLASGEKYVVYLSGTPTEPSGSNEERTVEFEVDGGDVMTSTLDLYPTATIKFGHDYEVTSMKLKSGTEPILRNAGNCSFSTPTEPTRIENGTCRLSADRTEVIVEFTGRALKTGPYKVVVTHNGGSETHTLDGSLNSDGSIEGSHTASLNDADFLIFGETYTVTSATLNTVSILYNSGIDLTIPGLPPIVDASCDVGQGTDHAWIELTGMSIAEGTYTVCLTESTLTFNVTFSGSKDSKGQYKSSKASVRLFGDEALLSFGTKYTVKSVADASTLAPVDLVGMIISFTTPAASSRLIGIGEKKLIGDQKDSVSVSLTGADLKNMEYWIETSPSSEVNGAKLSVVFSESSGTLVGKVYSVSGSGVALEYGRTYSITKMTNAENDAVLFVPLSFTVPDEPARLVNVSLTVDANMNTSTLTLTARQLASGEKYVVYLSGTPTEPSGSNEERTVEFEVDGGDVMTSTLDLYPTATIKFGHDYEVTSMKLKSGTEPILRNAGNCSFSTPTEPTRIENGTCRLSADRTEVIVEFTGRALKTGPYKVVVTHNGGSETHTLDGSLNSDGSIEGSHTASLNDADFLIFGETYTVTSATLNTVSILYNSDIDLTIPDLPPIVDASCDVGQGTDHAWIELTGMSIAEGTYTVCLSESTLTFNVTFSGSKDSKGQYKSSKASVRLFGDEALLSFGTKYTVKSVADASTLAPVDLVGMIISFTTPAASSRLTGIGEKKLIGDQKDSVSVSLTGADLKNMEYWIETSPSSEVNGAKLSVVFSESSGTLVGKVYSVSGSGVALEYGRTYSITKMTNAENDAVLFVPLSFTVPDEPARLVNVSLTVDANMNTSTLTLTARQLASGEKYVVYLSGTPTEPSGSNEERTVEFEVDGGDVMTSTLDLYPTATIKFGHDYEVTSMKLKSGTEPILRNAGNCSFSTPTEPTRIENGTCRLSADRTEVIVEFTGRALKTGPYKVVVTHNGGSETHTLDGSLNSDGSIEGSHTASLNDADFLIFGETYTVTSATLNTVSILYNSDIDLTIPDLPPIVDASCDVGQGTDHAWIELTGMSIAEGTYTVCLTESTLTFNVTFSGSKDSKGQYKSSKASVRLFGDEALLSFGTKYTVKSVADASTLAPVDLVGMIISFTTPAASSRLTGIGEKKLIGDQKDSVSVSLTGADLKNMEYWIETSPSSEVNGAKLSVVFSESSGTLVGKVYSVSGSGVALEYGRTYSITKMTNAENDAVLFVPLSFTVPDEPARLVNVSLTVDANMNTSTLTLTARQLASGEKYVVYLSGTPTEPSGSNEERTVEFEVDGGDVMTSTLDLYPTATIKFGHDYEVTSMKLKSGTEPILRNAGNCSFSTPTEPTRIENGTCRLSADRTEVIVEFTGRALKTGPYKVVVTHNGGSETHTLDGSLNSDGSIEGSHTASLNDADFLIFGETYTVTSATLNTVSILYNSDIDLTIPDLPPIVDASCDVGQGTDHAWIELTGMSIAEGTYTVCLTESTLTFNVTFSGSKDSKGQYKSSKASVRLFGDEALLSFGTKYTVKSVADASTLAPVDLVGMIISFTTPAASSRLTGIGEKKLIGDQKDSVSVSLTGADLKNMEYWIETSPSSEVNGAKLSVVFSESSGTLVGKVYSVSGSGVALEYGRTYSITKMTNAENDAVLFVPLSFTVPDEPARLVNVSLTVDANMNTSTLTLTARQLASGEKYVVYLSGTPTEPSGSNEERTVEFEVDGGDVMTSTLDLYPTATIKFGHDYEVTSMKLKSGTEPILRNAGNCSFSTPTEPTRIENGTCRLSADRTEVIVEFTGRALKTGPYKVVVTHNGGSETYTLSGTLNSNGLIHCSHAASLTDANFLVFGETYSVSSVTLNSKSVLLNANIHLLIPQPPKVTDALFSFTNSLNTTGFVTLTGTGLKLHGNYSVTLENGPTVTVPFTSDTTAISSTLLIGPVGCLQFSTTYTIATITRVDNADDVVVVVGEVTLKTEAKPTNLTIFVDEETGTSDSMCGDSKHPCSFIDDSWRIVSALSISKVQIQIVKSAVQTQSISIPSGGFLILTKAQLGGPTLRIPSTASAGESEGMVVVNGGSVEILSILIVIENQSDSFVFLFGMNSTILLSYSSITGSAQTSNSDTSSDDLCNWPSGMLRLLNCTATVTSSQLTHLSQGAINLEGGRLTVESSAFHDNSPNSTAFPSFRRNIRCLGQGEVTIESLSGGDGLLTGTSAWVSEEECSLKGEHAQRDTPLFIPTLSDSSKCELDSKTKVFSVEVKGEVLIPCGLWLEVVEWTKDKKEGKNVTFELSLATCLSLTENSITLHLAQSLLSSLDNSLEWRGRLIFGNEMRSTNSFLFQKSSADRIAQSVKNNMKWWLPLIIILAAAILITIVVVVLCRRRRKTQKLMKDDVSAEMDAEILEKLEDPEDRDTLMRNDIETSHRQLNTAGIPAEPPSVGISTQKSEEMPSVGLEAVEALVCGEASKVEIVLKRDTLFERLHGRTKQTVDAVEVGKVIVKGLRHLNKSDMFSVALVKWTPHWVLFDSKDRVCLRLNEVTNQTQLDLNGYSVVTDEGERWRAPEQTNGQLTANAERASVFRLGLVLLEMRTGLVPFGEIDATNASRQLCSGLLPPHWQVDEDFMSIVHDCLTLTPADRPLLFEIEERLTQYGKTHAGPMKEHKLMDAEPGDVFHSRPNERLVDH
ncbi:hypothetical protein BLNAU_10906 [Blattamonas nauphoetae]|uniref:Protein kinase domain-containing protein n=1 Tax=Blattamonas nauphoetae TaxID=2049346 RepID=A0ABQ9XR34_9EUKA|nr:hypothetical protein BLNAU_10906 [Blattamonas nauphoetae]